MRDMTDKAGTEAQAGRAGPAGAGRAKARKAQAGWIIALAAVALAGCQTANDDYPSPYGPSRRIPLPAVAGGGLWQPQPIRATGYGSATLISRLPQPPRVTPPARSSETPELLTAAQQAERQRALQAARDGHAGAMDRRLTSSGRVRGPDPGSRPAIEEDEPLPQSPPSQPRR